ncbi:MAG: Carbon starvation protein CstA [candidate division Zixibacteria bacterium RBG-1]|nr:MAG: Carbon starvation protein CstA [candidate division Zixibacteria bacterium RBG-1]OGC84464.1 MAG: carbon starvation protein CstA [candidate division Zixibacteria bacterium RBG_19FT_COMBO_42_43]
MNVLILFLFAISLFILASQTYSKYISKALGVDPNRTTPAVRFNDGRDYVPTKLHILFAHHFSAIAGAGPIVGPTMALLYGAVPAWLWIVLGGIFIGAVHDFTSLFASLQENGLSMAEIAKKTLGKPGFILFILFTLIMIVLVTSAFLTATAVSLTSKWPIAKLGADANSTFLRTETAPDGTVLGIIGGIASMSVIVITLLSPLLGYLLYKRKINLILAYGLASVIMAGSVVAGIYYPIRFSAETWMILLSIYVLFAAGLPVWMILQPRDFINVQILYAGIAGMLLALLVGGASGLSFQAPSFNVAEGTKNLGLIWPMLFITIACGAISGFHAMIATGTTSKQLAKESQARKVGYNGMLLECTLAVCVLLTVGSGLLFADYKGIVWPENGRSNPILAFSLAVGYLLNQTFGLSMALGAVFGILLVEGFVITTLDVAVRLNRYLFEEFWRILFKQVPRLFQHYWFNAALAVFLMWLLAYSNTFAALWPIFGTGNQLLATLSLMAVSVWLYYKGKKTWYTVLPAIFMLATTVFSLILLLVKTYLPKGNWALVFTDLLLLALALAVAVLAVKTFFKLVKVGTVKQELAG